MSTNPLQAFVRNVFQGMLLFGLSGAAFAQNAAQPQPHFTLIAAPKGGMLLEVQQMPLAQVLDTLAAKTHIAIHYSALPEGLVSAYCPGTHFKDILECLLARKADLLIRYPQATDVGKHGWAIEEIWLKGSSVAGSPQALAVATRFPHPENARIRQILELAQSPNAQERADAMAALLAEGNLDDPAVTAALEQALDDEDPKVRAQALSSYAHHENGAAVTQAILAAMNDSSADVRLMAVDSINNDRELLQQASNDPDENIRTLAAMKLEALAIDE